MKKTIAFVLFPGFQIVDLAAVTVFEVANGGAGGPFYDIAMVSEHGGPVASSSGVRIDSVAFAGHAHDTVVLAGAMQVVPSSAGLLAYVRAASAASRRTASICTGAFVLAEAGLLEGRRVTTH